MQKQKINGLVWFRNNLRVEDNRSLTNAISNSDKVIGFINIDPRNFISTKYGFKKTEKFRAKFFLESVKELKNQLEKLNISLVVTHDYLDKSIPHIIEQYEIEKVFLQSEWTRDELLEESYFPKNIDLVKDFDQFLYSPKDVKTLYDNIPRGFSNFRKKCEKYLSVDNIIPIPKPLNNDNKITIDYQIPSLLDLGFDLFEVHKNSVFVFMLH